YEIPYDFLKKASFLVKKKNRIIIKNRITNYEFFDGLKKHEVNGVYDNWLSSIDYKTYSKAHIKIGDVFISLFGDNSKKIQLSKENIGFDKETLIEIATTFSFEIEEKSNDVVLFNMKNKYDTYYLTYHNIKEREFIIIF